MSVRRLSDLYRTAFVTGASSGLGRAFAVMLLAEGVKVWGTARDSGRLGDLCANPNFTPVMLDLEHSDEALAAFSECQERAGGFDLVVQNAGYGVFGSFSETPFDVWRRQWESMLITTARISHAAFGSMMARRRGCLVHVSSVAVTFPLPYMSGYNVAKAGLSALSESLMQESAGTSVRVIDFRPGDYRTAFTHGRADLKDPEMAGLLAKLEKHLEEAPLPERAARDLRVSLLRERSGIVSSGSFFQACFAPFLTRLGPSSWRRAVMDFYFRHL